MAKGGAVRNYAVGFHVSNVSLVRFFQEYQRWSRGPSVLRARMGKVCCQSPELLHWTVSRFAFKCYENYQLAAQCEAHSALMMTSVTHIEAKPLLQEDKAEHPEALRCCGGGGWSTEVVFLMKIRKAPLGKQLGGNDAIGQKQQTPSLKLEFGGCLGKVETRNEKESVN